MLIWWVACAWIGPADRDAFEDRDADGLVYHVDCDDLDPGVGGGESWYADDDGDGWGDDNRTRRACEAPKGYARRGEDCDDRDAATFPGSTERCGGGDDDCDGLADDLDPEGVLGAPSWYLDADRDGVGGGEGLTACEAPADRLDVGGDCDDADPDVHPGAVETCGGVDDDCDGRIDDADTDVEGLLTWYADGDADGYGDAAVATDACVAPGGFVATASDCDDADPAVGGPSVWYADADADAFGDPASPSLGCGGAGYAADPDDCDDTDPAVNPAAQEVCDALEIDEDCDGAADDADGSATNTGRYFVDGDGDGHGDPSAVERWCDPPADVSIVGDDCDDVRADVFTGAVEVYYDGIDQSCDGGSDFDADGDGHDDAAHGGGDCDDTDPTVAPDAPEVYYDGVDSDCDRRSDEDADGDGADRLPDGDDCDDTDPTVAPDAPEVWYDGVDQDCSGGSDDDQDGDGRDRLASGGTDCDDTDPAVYPGADEFIDGEDSNCDGADAVCGAVVRRVPLDYATPQLAVAAACAGDVVRLSPGDWTGPLTVNLNLTLEGDGPGVRIVGDGAHRVVSATRGTFRDLEITGGYDVGGGGMRILGGFNVRLERVAITASDGQFENGGGLLIRNSGGVVLEDVLVAGNRCEYDGGGVAIEDSTVAVHGLVARENRSGKAGGLHALRTDGLVLEDAVFERNTARYDSGGLRIADADNVVVRVTEIVGNTADASAGLTLAYTTDTRLERVTVRDNATPYGISGASLGGTGTVVVDSAFVGNRGANYGAVRVTGPSARWERVVVQDNVSNGNAALIVDAAATDSAFFAIDVSRNNAGGLHTAAARAVFEQVTLDGNGGYAFASVAEGTLRGARVTGTANGATAAVAVRGGRATLDGVVVLGSRADGLSIDGPVDAQGLVIAGNDGRGVVATAAATGSIDHATLVGNAADGYRGATAALTLRHLLATHNLIGVQAPAGAIVGPCALYGNATAPVIGGASDTACVAADPRFSTWASALSPLAWDLHLGPTSPLIDAGDPDGDADGTAADIGAYGGLWDGIQAAVWYQDRDADAMYDGWEVANHLDASRDDAALDPDRDGLDNAAEFVAGTSPMLGDTDGDGLLDGVEAQAGTDPTSPDDP